MKELIGCRIIGESHIFGIPIELGIGTDRHISQKDCFCKRTGEVEMLLRCAVLSARIAQADDNPEAARDALDHGLGLARQHGFRLFEVNLLRLDGQTAQADALARDLGCAL